MRKTSLPLDETKKLPIPGEFAKEGVVIVKSLALKPEIEPADRSVHW